MSASLELDPRIETDLRAVLRSMAPATAPAALEQATLGATPVWRPRARTLPVVSPRLATAVAILMLAALMAAFLASVGGPKPTISIYLVNEPPNSTAAVVRVGVSSDGADPSNPGTEVAWLRVEPGTYQELPGIPAGTHLVALVVRPDCTVSMERPWTWTGPGPGGPGAPDAPANQQFYTKGPAGGVDLSGWGSANQLPTVKSRFVAAALDRVPNPCVGKELVAVGPGTISSPLSDAVAAVDSYAVALAQGNYSTAWAMLGPENQAMYGSLAAFTSDRSRALAAEPWRSSPSVGNARDPRSISDWMTARYGTTHVDLSNAILVEVSYMDMPPTRTSELYVVVPVNGETLIYQVR
jgi:hypothetical protein